jgi:hypothetical protein
MLARRNRGRWSTVVAAVGGLALVIGVGWVVLSWVREGSAVAEPRASVLGFLLAAALAVVGLVGWVRRRRVAAAAPVTAEQVGRAVATLAQGWPSSGRRRPGRGRWGILSQCRCAGDCPRARRGYR